jgi:hypothetical protein
MIRSLKNLGMKLACRDVDGISKVLMIRQNTEVSERPAFLQGPPEYTFRAITQRKVIELIRKFPKCFPFQVQVLLN